ncbi:MAG TPA: dTDP-4-dehydrorhamnose reductase [bacterium]|nr:dTDP-4-dehydrorhamnose reductase [bacterium]
MKIALLGSTGMLGSKMAEVAKARGHEVLAARHSEVDLEHPYTIEKFFNENSFDILVNCAGFTRVDACEEAAKFSLAWNVNGVSVGWLAKYCKKFQRVFVHYSTDYVFDGAKEGAYIETDPARPLNVYGKTKLQGEKLILAEKPVFYLIRTSWVYGPRGVNFVDKMAELMQSKPRVEVVSDQTGGPTYTGDLALFTLELLEKKVEPGLYHFCNEGAASWFQFAKEIQKQLGLTSCDVAPILSENIFRPAQRPANSRFDLSKASKALGHGFRPWPEALGEYLKKEYQNGRA